MEARRHRAHVLPQINHAAIAEIRAGLAGVGIEFEQTRKIGGG